MLLSLNEQLELIRTKTRNGRRNIMFKDDVDFFARFASRLSRLGIELEFASNYPWIYLIKINGHTVTEKRRSEHYFTVALVPIKIDGKLKVLDLNETFHVIRKYAQLGRKENK